MLTVAVVRFRKAAGSTGGVDGRRGSGSSSLGADDRAARLLGGGLRAPPLLHGEGGAAREMMSSLRYSYLLQPKLSQSVVCTTRRVIKDVLMTFYTNVVGSMSG